MKRALPLVLLIPAVACASAQAKSPAARPNLEVPAPPPRVIEAMPSEPPLPEPVGELPAAPATPRPRTSPPPVSRESSNKPDPKPEAAPVDQAPAAILTPPPPAATATPQLRKPGAPDGAEASRQVRDVIDRAKKTLGSIDYQRLSTERRDQYDSANLLITQSEDAIKTLKFDIARNLADKADRIAKELQTR